MLPDASEASRNSPDFWTAFWISPPLRSGVELVCCASTCTTACWSGGGRLSEPAAALRLANNGARLLLLRGRSFGRDRHRYALERRQGIVGAGAAAGAIVLMVAGDCGATPVGSPVSRGARALPDHAGAPAVLRLRHRKLQVLPRRQRDFRSTSIESPAIAICTRFSATLEHLRHRPSCRAAARRRTVALPAACAAMTGRTGLIGQRHGRKR